MTDPLHSLLGSLVMTGWIGTDPRDGSDIATVYLGTPGDGTVPAEDIMPTVAALLGLDPQPGSMTMRPKTDTHVTFTTDGWIDLRFPGDVDGIQHPGDPEWQATAEQCGEVLLALTYLPMASGEDGEAHCERTVTASAFSLGLIPVR
jgi:hypothetical protein